MKFTELNNILDEWSDEIIEKYGCLILFCFIAAVIGTVILSIIFHEPPQ